MIKNVSLILGKKFGRLTVISLLGKRTRKCGIKTDNWVSCECDCGKIMEVTYSGVTTGNTKSCGCLVPDNARITIKSAHKRNKKEYGLAAFNDIYGSYKRAAQYRNLVWNLTKEEARDLFKHNCTYCGQEPETNKDKKKRFNGDFIYNGIDRVDNTKGYEMGNVVTCCATCNRMKSNMTQDEFYGKIAKIHNIVNKS